MGCQSHHHHTHGPLRLNRPLLIMLESGTTMITGSIVCVFVVLLGAIARVSALEVELARLRSQIADYALAETDSERDNDPPNPPPPPAIQVWNQCGWVGGGSFTWSNINLRHICLFQLHSLAMPTPSGNSTSTPKVAMGTTHLLPELMATPGCPTHASDMLQSINSIKLRRVEGDRSPGGTPLRPANVGGQVADPNDPASIITMALRRKFSNPVFQDSPGAKLYVGGLVHNINTQ